MKMDSNLLQLKIDEIKELEKENFNLKDKLNSLNKADMSLKKITGLDELTLEKLGYRLRLGEDWIIKRRGFVTSYYNNHHTIFKELFKLFFLISK